MENRKNQEKRLIHGAAPPLTAVERFLYGQKYDTLSTKKQESLIDRSILMKSRYSKENSMFGPKKEKNLALNGGNRKFIGDYDDESVTSKGIITKKRPNKYLIKGQWTIEEDIKLVELVRQHGDRKWSIISEKLVGRAGKQCRERWHNHLRPDIKKDSWSEEEEKVLVEAHTKIGNKWAEIAKLIQGRTENSIKNHWNATKRRQNSKRKNKRTKNTDNLSPSAKRPRLLENYIKSIENNEKNNGENIITTSGNNSLLSMLNLCDVNSDGDSTSSLLDDPYDEELLFLKNIFASHSMSLDNMDLSQGSEMTIQSSSNEFMIKNPNPNLSNTSDATTHHGTMVTSPHEKNTPHLASDIYLSNLLDGSASCSSSYDLSSTSSTSIEQGGYTEFLAPPGNSTSERREMDLIEMLSGSTQGSNNIWFPLF